MSGSYSLENLNSLYSRRELLSVLHRFFKAKELSGSILQREEFLQISLIIRQFTLQSEEKKELNSGNGEGASDDPPSCVQCTPTVVPSNDAKDSPQELLYNLELDESFVNNHPEPIKASNKMHKSIRPTFVFPARRDLSSSIPSRRSREEEMIINDQKKRLWSRFKINIPCDDTSLYGDGPKDKESDSIGSKKEEKTTSPENLFSTITTTKIPQTMSSTNTGIIKKEAKHDGMTGKFLPNNALSQSKEVTDISNDETKGLLKVQESKADINRSEEVNRDKPMIFRLDEQKDKDKGDSSILTKIVEKNNHNIKDEPPISMKLEDKPSEKHPRFSFGQVSTSEATIIPPPLPTTETNLQNSQIQNSNLNQKSTNLFGIKRDAPCLGTSPQVLFNPFGATQNVPNITPPVFSPTNTTAQPIFSGISQNNQVQVPFGQPKTGKFNFSFSSSTPSSPSIQNSLVANPQGGLIITHPSLAQTEPPKSTLNFSSVAGRTISNPTRRRRPPQDH